MSHYISWEDETPLSDQELLRPITLLCGSMASFDHASGISYRCETCFATVGSIGMPRQCKELYEMQEVVDKLKGLK